MKQLHSFLKSHAKMFMWTPLPISKVMNIVLYRLTHGIFVEHMGDLYNIGASIIRKYTTMVCEILANNDKLFNNYIHTQSASQLCSIIEKFKNFTRLWNIAGVINRIHILLFEKSNRIVFTFVVNLYNNKKFHNIVLHGLCDYDKIF